MAKQKVTNHETQVTKQVVSHIRRMIENGTLQAGDKIPPEREFAHNLKISRASLRTGIGYLAAMGVLKIRHGVGTFVSDGPPDLGHASLSLLGALHGFKLWQLFEARLILERNLASLAAERGLDENFAALAEEVAEMYATVDDPADYLIHDVRFHRAIAEAAGNPILAAVMETIASSLYEQRRTTVERAQNLKDSAKEHREIYRAIRSRNAAEARQAMERHLKTAQAVQEMEQASTREKTRKPRLGASVRNNSRHQSRIGLYAPKRVE
jgi:GntR family transcriptional regulator, transcriptional repressor for pyruvate dehydrogenase complex